MTDERRIDERALTAALVEVHCRTSRHVGVVEDLSSSGACFRMETELPLGQQVVAFIGKVFQLCIVRYCAKEDDAWRVGVSFTAPWPETVEGVVHHSSLLEGNPTL